VATNLVGAAESLNDVEIMAAPVMLVDKPIPYATATTNGDNVSFKRYMNDGCEIDLCVAIDFTSSNGKTSFSTRRSVKDILVAYFFSLALDFLSGDPREPDSLHYQTDESLNDYEEVIRGIGDALATFSTSKMFPVWGFGAKFGGVVRHIFQCGTSKEVKGVDAILEAYRSVFRSNLIMSGPTVLDQVIQAAAMRAKRYQVSTLIWWGNRLGRLISSLLITRLDHCLLKNLGSTDLRYCVLLIITDGIVDDLEETKRKLRVYSQLPLSVIIAGVGRTEFHVMHSLSDIPGSRRNTAFVEYRQHQYDPSSLAKAALEHIPQQIVDYFEVHRFNNHLTSSVDS
jgi:hypothetical protein